MRAFIVAAALALFVLAAPATGYALVPQPPTMVEYRKNVRFHFDPMYSY